jgi:hypothetical protein
MAIDDRGSRSVGVARSDGDRYQWKGERPSRSDAPTINREDLAYHEAGHVVLAVLCGRKAMSVSITDDPRRALVRSDRRSQVTLGLTLLEPLPPGVDLCSPDYRALAEREGLIALAGDLAMFRNRGRRWAKDLSRDDLNGLSYAAIHARASHHEVEGTLDRIARRVGLLLDLYWPRVTAVAEALLRHGSLTGGELAKLLTADHA